jgi:hypothetical protein
MERGAGLGRPFRWFVAWQRAGPVSVAEEHVPSRDPEPGQHLVEGP